MVARPAAEMGMLKARPQRARRGGVTRVVRSQKREGEKGYPELTQMKPKRAAVAVPLQSWTRNCEPRTLVAIAQVIESAKQSANA